MLDDVLAIVFRPFGSSVIAVVDSDMAAERWGSGLERGGCGVCRCGINRHGSVCRRFRAAGASFEAGGKVVIVVVNNVGCADGGCADVVSGDVAVSRGMPECVSRVCIAVSVVLGVTWVLKSTVEIVVIWERAFSCSCDGSS